MITQEEIAIKVREVLLASDHDGVPVVWQRTGYDKTEEIVIVKGYADGEGSFRNAVITVNIHVPDIFNKESQVYEENGPRFIVLKKLVNEALRRYYWTGTGINWEITGMSQPMKERDYNEHFVSVRITAHIRES